MPNPRRPRAAGQAVVDANANPPYLFELGPDQGPRTVDAVQSGPVKKLTVDIEDTTVQMVRPAEQRLESSLMRVAARGHWVSGRPLSNPPPSAAGIYGRNCWAILATWPCSTVIQNGAVPLFGK
jgi:hypothetical protein